MGGVTAGQSTEPLPLTKRQEARRRLAMMHTLVIENPGLTMPQLERLARELRPEWWYGNEWVPRISVLIMVRKGDVLKLVGPPRAGSRSPHPVVTYRINPIPRRERNNQGEQP